MSIRKRKWKSADGVELTAWVVNYTDQAGKRRLKTFDKKKSADDFDANTRNEVRTGIHTPDSSSITVAEGGDRWISACESAGLESTRFGRTYFRARRQASVYDASLKKACAETHIPVLGRVHWAKHRAGQTPARIRSPVRPTGMSEHVIRG